MGKRLTEDGWRVVGVEAIADDEQAIVDALNRAETEADVVLLTGGLGPTKDDITKTTLAKHFGTELVMHEDIAENIEAWFRSRNVPFLEVNRLQAMLPRRARRCRTHWAPRPACGLNGPMVRWW